MKLLPKASLIKTSEVDQAGWNFSPLLGFIQRRRFKLIISLLSGKHFCRLLEIGYGSGVFMPELQGYCDELYGIDLHGFNEQVHAVLMKYDVSAKLFTGDVNCMPFPSNFFDCIIAVSALEYTEPEVSCQEINRVLMPEGALVLVTPGYSPIIDFCLRIVTHKNAGEEYGDRREKLLPALERVFSIEKQLTFPPFGPPFTYLYRALRCIKQGRDR